MHYAKEKKPNSKGHITHDVLKRAKPKRQKTGQRMPEVRGRRRVDKGHKRIWGDDGTVVHLDYSDGCTSASVNIHRTVHKNDEFHCAENRPQ